MKLIDDFSRSSVLVVGDVMLDRYWWGDVTRISPEAPVPVVRLRKDTYVPGGAANVALNVAGLGAKVSLLGVVGRDTESDHLRDGLDRAGVSTDFLVTSTSRPTNVKTRVIAHNQQVVRVDRETTSGLTAAETEHLLKNIAALILNADVVLLSDYAKGTLSDDLLKHIFDQAAATKTPVCVDPKGKDFSKYRGASILTPNRKETAEACNLDPETDGLVAIAGDRLLDELHLRALLVTESEEGMTLFEKDQKSIHFDAVAKEVYDVTGAGDTVIATIGVALASGSGFREAAKLANIAAGIVVQQLGTASITAEKLAVAYGEFSVPAA